MAAPQVPALPPIPRHLCARARVPCRPVSTNSASDGLTPGRDVADPPAYRRGFMGINSPLPKTFCADFLLMLLFGGALMCAVAPFINIPPFLGSSLAFMMVYVWGRPEQRVRKCRLADPGKQHQHTRLAYRSTASAA